MGLKREKNNHLLILLAQCLFAATELVLLLSFPAPLLEVCYALGNDVFKLLLAGIGETTVIHVVFQTLLDMVAKTNSHIT
jgi:hypothetical protein